MKLKDSSRILVLAPHTDDGEWGCGASMAKFLEEGHEVFYVALSSCKTSLSEGLPKNTLQKECEAALIQLGVTKKVILDYEVRYFSYKRQEILEDLVNIGREFQPDLVFTPCSTDTHQDHKTVYEESLRAFKKSNILGYELIWNTIKMSTNFFIAVEEKHLLQKTKALMCYKSQEHRSYHNEEFIRSLAYTRGTQIGQHYAEAFESIKWVI